MKTLIVTNVYCDKEVNKAKIFNDRFGDDFRIVTHLDIGFGKVWKVDDYNKRTVEWTKRILRKFLEEPYDVLLKIDPDVIIKSVPEMPLNCDVAGDFRKPSVGWIWFGACQYYTRSAVERILSDALYTGKCMYQDVELAKVIKRLSLKAYNMEEVDMWCEKDSPALITHRSQVFIQRLSSGPITMTD